jgi:hypothetical protein
MIVLVPDDEAIADRPPAIVPHGCVSEPHAPVPPPGATKTPALVSGSRTQVPLHGVHIVHAPFWQTSFVPHTVPFVACIPVSVHAGGFVVQSRVPVSHGLAVGVHMEPVEHITHAPISQISPVPHELPLATLIPVSVQTDTPVEQSVVPVWQALVGMHGLLAAHAEHIPLLQTMAVPHDVPLPAFIPVSLQMALPVEQSILPAWHAMAGVQAAPEVHAAASPSCVLPSRGFGPSVDASPDPPSGEFTSAVASDSPPSTDPRT